MRNYPTENFKKSHYELPSRALSQRTSRELALVGQQVRTVQRLKLWFASLARVARVSGGAGGAMEERKSWEPAAMIWLRIATGQPGEKEGSMVNILPREHGLPRH